LPDEVVDAGEVDGEPGLAGGDGESDGEVGFPDAGWSEEGDVAVAADELQGREVADAAGIEVGLERFSELRAWPDEPLGWFQMLGY